MVSEKLVKVIVDLFKINGLKFGSFLLKSGILSPVYFDLRVIISHPEVMKLIVELVGEELETLKGKFDVMCGIVYTALPIASILSVQKNIPMVIKRKEQKKYGTGNLIEGKYSEGTRCILIEDVITSGSSIVETADSLREHGMKVTHSIVLLDRGQGASINLNRNGIQTKALIQMNEMLEVLLDEKLITSEQKLQVEQFLNQNQLFTKELELLQKSQLSKISSPTAAKLLKIMYKKKSNLCLSVDLDKWEEVLEAADLLGSKICLVKTHIDTINLKGVKIITEFRNRLKELAQTHEFLIMEDRKFADIGSTVKKQLTSKPFEIDLWADMVTAHGIAGPGILQAIQTLNRSVSVVLIAEMSSEGNLATKLPGYKNEILALTQGFESSVAGFVSQSRVTPVEHPKSGFFLQFTPGVSLEPAASGDGLGQQYCSVEEAILKRNADVIIVGRGILKESKENWIKVGEAFREKGWKAFENKVAASI